MKKTVKIIFTLSLLLNIALIGVVAGGLYKRHKWHKPPMELSEKSREILQKNMQEGREKMKEKFSQMRANNTALNDVVSAEKFEREAYDQAVSKILDHRDEFSRMKAQSMGDVLSQLSQEERQKISKRLVHSLSGGGKHEGARTQRFKYGDKFKRFSDREQDRPE